MIQRMLPVAILGGMLACLPTLALAIQAKDLGIDCKKAVSTPEVALCINDAYEAADKRLN